MKIDNLSVGDIITQFRGPQTGLNYGGTAKAYCETMVESIGGSGAVKVQYNISPILGYDNTIRTVVPDPAQWVDVATISTNGLTRSELTVKDDLYWIRVIVSHVGTGQVNSGGRWSKR